MSELHFCSEDFLEDIEHCAISSAKEFYVAHQLPPALQKARIVPSHTAFTAPPPIGSRSSGSASDEGEVWSYLPNQAADAAWICARP